MLEFSAKFIANGPELGNCDSSGEQVDKFLQLLEFSWVSWGLFSAGSPSFGSTFSMEGLFENRLQPSEISPED